MTYINIDSGFVELGALASLMCVPEYEIVNIVDQGSFGFEDQFDTMNSSEILLRKVRFASFLATVNVPEDAKIELIKSFAEGNSIESSLNALYSEEKIDREQLVALLSWKDE